MFSESFVSFKEKAGLFAPEKLGDPVRNLLYVSLNTKWTSSKRNPGQPT